MQLTEKTVAILKNFATIQPNLVFRGDEMVKTMSEGRNILASAKLESFPEGKMVGIYDLNEFIGTLGLMDKPEIKFDENHMMISDQSGRSRIRYYYASLETLTSPTKDIQMPSAEVKFTLDEDTLNRLRRAASNFGHEELLIEPADGALRFTVTNLANSSSNTYSIDVAGEYDSENFKFVFLINNLKFIPGDYEASLSKKLIAHFKSKTDPVEYWVAMEKSSEYN